VVFCFVAVAKDSSSPMILKLVLQGLSSPWKPNMQVLMTSHDLPTEESTIRDALFTSGKSNNGGQGTTITRQSGSPKMGELLIARRDYL